MAQKTKKFIKYFLDLAQFYLSRLKFSGSNKADVEGLRCLKDQGFLQLKKHTSPAALLKFKNDFILDYKIGVDFVPVHLHKDALDDEIRSEKFRRVTQDHSLDSLRQLTNYLKYRDPLVRWPSIIETILSEDIIDIAEAYLGAKPAITGCTFNRMFANSILPMEAQRIHSDGNSVKFLKVFAYLQDTGPDMGPTHYFAGSHKLGVRKRLADSYRIHPNYIKGLGFSEAAALTGEIGDINICDTTGFHYGAKPKTRDRDMITLNLSIHREYFSSKVHLPPKIKAVDAYWFRRMKKRGLFRYAQIV